MLQLKKLSRTSIVFAMLVFFNLPQSVNAQQSRLGPEDPDNLVHFAYSSLFGSGYYKIGDRSVGVIELPFSIDEKVAGIDHHYGFKWLLPLSLGLHSFDPDDLIEDSDRVSTLSFVPGIELDFRLPSGWQLRPHAQLGYAFDVGSSSESATIYSVGVKGRRQLIPLESERIGLTFGIKGAAAGYNPENGNDNSLGFVATGVDLQWPLAWRPRGALTFVGLSIYGNYYYETARFSNIVNKEDEAEYEFTASIALGFRDAKRILNIPFDRIGIGYKRGDDIRAILLVTDFPF